MLTVYQLANGMGILIHVMVSGAAGVCVMYGYPRYLLWYTYQLGEFMGCNIEI